MSATDSRPGKTNAREVAYQVVRDVFGPEARGAQAAFDVRARRANLDARDRAFAAELAYGSIKLRRLIDWQLAPYVGDRGKPLVSTIADVLRLGVYQLRFMSGVDDHAAVSETVNLAWRHGHRGTAGLVNAVLRRMLAEEPLAPVRADFSTAADYLGTVYSVPTWVAAQYARTLDGSSEAALAGINVAPRAAVRVNTLRCDTVAAAEYLAANGVVTTPSKYVAETLLVQSGVPSDDAEGRWMVQGEAAAFPVELLEPRPDESILEFCSGRGNKTVQIAARMENRGELICVERDPKKMAVLERTLESAGVTIAARVLGDALEAARDVRADAVLLDAPCSGLGVLGRHPEARWRKSPEDGARLATTQAALLRAAAASTRPGGRLVYSVCSLDPREGSEIVDAFLASDASFSRGPLPERFAAFSQSGALAVPPGIDGRDGFFIAALVRTAS